MPMKKYQRMLALCIMIVLALLTATSYLTYRVFERLYEVESTVKKVEKSTNYHNNRIVELQRNVDDQNKKIEVILEESQESSVVDNKSSMRTEGQESQGKKAARAVGEAFKKLKRDSNTSHIEDHDRNEQSFYSLEECANKSISNLSGMSVLSVSGSSSGAKIVMSESIYDTVMKSEQTGGDIYDNLAMALSISRMCWAEHDPASRGVKVDIVTPSGMLIVKGL